MKKYLITIIYLISQFQAKLSAQPHPSDKGPGDPGGFGTGGQQLGAPLDDFVWGIIVFSLIYLSFKWYQLKIQSSQITSQ
jgi:hypothetical protein